MSNYQIKLENFEGPIEVLLRLVEEKKLHISQVSLAAVADDFISFLEKLEQQSNSDKNQIANFILVASTLMLIKSVSLLPQLKITDDEKGSIEDLEKRLKLYQQIKELSQEIKSRYGKKVIFTRQIDKQLKPVFSPSSDISLDTLKSALWCVIDNLPRVEKLPQIIVQKVISLEEAIADLTTRVQSALKISFNHFVRDKKEKVNIIVSFLGMLELVKRGIVSVEQDNHFTDIAIEPSEANLPRYG